MGQNERQCAHARTRCTRCTQASGAAVVRAREVCQISTLNSNKQHTLSLSAGRRQERVAYRHSGARGTGSVGDAVGEGAELIHTGLPRGHMGSKDKGNGVVRTERAPVCVQQHVPAHSYTPHAVQRHGRGRRVSTRLCRLHAVASAACCAPTRLKPLHRAVHLHASTACSAACSGAEQAAASDSPAALPRHGSRKSQAESGKRATATASGQQATQARSAQERTCTDAHQPLRCSHLKTLRSTKRCWSSTSASTGKRRATSALSARVASARQKSLSTASGMATTCPSALFRHLLPSPRVRASDTLM